LHHLDRQQYLTVISLYLYLYISFDVKVKVIVLFSLVIRGLVFVFSAELATDPLGLAQLRDIKPLPQSARDDKPIPHPVERYKPALSTN
jgi:hypothetical protein